MEKIIGHYIQENGKTNAVALIKFYDGSTCTEDRYNRIRKIQTIRRLAINKQIMCSKQESDKESTSC